MAKSEWKLFNQFSVAVLLLSVPVTSLRAVSIVDFVSLLIGVVRITRLLEEDEETGRGVTGMSAGPRLVAELAF